MSAQPDRIPLFPLRSVLVPGGRLTLRIFEPRYLDLVRECARGDTGFGVCLVHGPDPAGGPPTHSPCGTLALIRDFFTHQDGLLGITAEGQRRFRLTGTRARDNGLLIGEVEWLPEPPPTEVPVACALLSEVTERVLEQADGSYPGFRRELLQDAAWVGYRLVEWLPLELAEKQALLELDDPVLRLEALLEALPRIGSRERG